MKFHEIATYQTVHSISFPSPVLTAAVASDDSVVCAGMSDGLVQFLHRKDTPDVMNNDTDRYFQFHLHFENLMAYSGIQYNASNDLFFSFPELLEIEQRVKAFNIVICNSPILNHNLEM